MLKNRPIGFGMMVNPGAEREQVVERTPRTLPNAVPMNQQPQKQLILFSNST